MSMLSREEIAEKNKKNITKVYLENSEPVIYLRRAKINCEHTYVCDGFCERNLYNNGKELSDLADPQYNEDSNKEKLKCYVGRTGKYKLYEHKATEYEYKGNDSKLMERYRNGCSYVDVHTNQEDFEQRTIYASYPEPKFYEPLEIEL